jgi:exonuclease SbcD
LPYRHPVKVASDESGDIGLRKELMQQKYVEQIVKEIETFTGAGKDDADVCILMGHFSIQGAVAGSERNWSMDEEYAVPPTVFDNSVFDYIAMGHVHRHQAIKASTPIVYPGSIERVDLAEAVEDKGFVHVEIRDGSAYWKYIKLPTRAMYNLQISCQEKEDAIVAVKRQITAHQIRDAIVNLEITLSEQISPNEKSEINGLLKEAFWSQVHYVRRQTQKEAEEGTLVRTLEPAQALNEYLKSLKIPEAKRNEAMKIGQQIIIETTAKAES